MILNPWLWVITQRNMIAAILTFVLSLVFLKFYFKNKRFFLPTLIFTLMLAFIAVRQAHDESIFRNSALDIQQINKRHEFYAKGLGKFYTNRLSLDYYKNFSIPLHKLQSNLFSNLDFNLYFFASHPRERAGVEEFNKFYPFFLPLFIAGLLYTIYKRLIRVLIYVLTVSLISAFISPFYNLGPILFFPVVSVIITVGILSGLKKVGIKNEI